MTSLPASESYHSDLNENTRVFAFGGFYAHVCSWSWGLKKINQHHLLLKQDRANNLKLSCKGKVNMQKKTKIRRLFCIPLIKAEHIATVSLEAYYNVKNNDIRHQWSEFKPNSGSRYGTLRKFLGHLCVFDSSSLKLCCWEDNMEKGFPCDSNDKASVCQCRGYWFNPWVRKVPCRRRWQPTPNILAWKIPWTEEPGGLQSMGSQRMGHELATIQQSMQNQFVRELLFLS